MVFAWRRFLALSSGIIYGYYAYVLRVDEEEFGGHGALLQEGLFASFTLFLVLFPLPSITFFFFFTLLILSFPMIPKNYKSMIHTCATRGCGIIVPDLIFSYICIYK